MIYEIVDNNTGKKYDLDWKGDKPPTEDEVHEAVLSTNPSFSKNLAEDVKNVAVGLPTQIGQGISAVGKTASDILTGGLLQPNKVGSYKNILDSVKQLQQSAEDVRKEYKQRYGEGIGSAFYKKPISSSLDVAALLGGAGVLGKSTGLLKNTPKTLKPTKILQERDLIDTAEVLPIKLEKTNIQNLASNKYVQDNLGNFAGKQAAEKGFEASEITKQVKPAIREAQNQFYKNLGIKDTDPVNVGDAIIKIKNEITNKKDFVDDIAVKKARNIYKLIVDNTDKETKTISFGKIKDITNNIYDLAEDNVNDMGRKTSAGKFFTKIGNALTEAKKTDPRIAQASGQYSDLMNAEKLINKTLRLNREMGEMRLEGKINSSFKDKGQLTFKENLNKLENILNKYPETQNLVSYGGFTDRIKLAQVANDISTKKATIPSGLSRFGVQALGNLVKVGDPNFQAQLLVKGIKSGKINPEAVMGKSRNYPSLITGGIQTRAMALKDIFKFPAKKILKENK